MRTRRHNPIFTLGQAAEGAAEDTAASGTPKREVVKKINQIHLEQAADGGGEGQVAEVGEVLAIERVAGIHLVLPFEEGRQRLKNGQHTRVARLAAGQEKSCLQRMRRLNSAEGRQRLENGQHALFARLTAGWGEST